MEHTDFLNLTRTLNLFRAISYVVPFLSFFETLHLSSSCSKVLVLMSSPSENQPNCPIVLHKCSCNKNIFDYILTLPPSGLSKWLTKAWFTLLRVCGTCLHGHGSPFNWCIILETQQLLHHGNFPVVPAPTNMLRFEMHEDTTKNEWQRILTACAGITAFPAPATTHNSVNQA